jgi:hypothetical protein
MNFKASLISALVLVLLSSLAGEAGKKRPMERGMLAKMEAVPCGGRERGITGIGGVLASAGVTHVNTDEKLCPQYVLRTDTMEYHIRPIEKKHPAILPVGHEGLFRVNKDHLVLRIEDMDRKERHYEVVSVKPLRVEQSDWGVPSAQSRPPHEHELEKEP